MNYYKMILDKTNRVTTNAAGSGVFCSVNLVFSPKDKVIIVFPTVGVIYMSERNQLDRLTL